MNKWIICPVCNGDGTTVNPAIDSNGISTTELYEDPEFHADYMSGVYDQNCAACDGSGKMLESHIEDLREAAKDRQLAAMEDGNYEAYQGAGDWRWGA